ncbi:MAG: DUF2285 domain-containing protein [Tabrizicola sp.]|nr:DUF2285 domain-containing protein [Tabrizicola sp.]
MHAVVYWQPEADPGTIILTARTPFSGQEPTPLPELDKDSARYDPDGLSLRIGIGASSVRLLMIDGARPGLPVAALIPLDESCADRIEAVSRLSQLLRRRPPVADTRMTVQRRRRLRQMLQAIDGHLDGATYRNIAKVLYGDDRIAEHPWKTSSLRDSTIALVRDGRALIDGGYRGLLVRQRRK